MKFEKLLIAAGAGLLGIAVLVGCASFPTVVMTESEPAQAEHPAEAAVQGRGGGIARSQPTPMTIPGSGPATPPPPEATPEQLNALIRDEPLNAILPPQPLAQFLNAAFMNVLNVPYSLGPGVGTRTEIITINAPQTINKRSYALMLRNALRNYGLVMAVNGNAISIVEDGAQVSGGRGGGPQVVRSRSSADTPAGNRQVIQYFQLVALQADPITPFVNETLLRGTGVTASSDPAANALLLSGPARSVAGAVDMLRNLDKPAFAGAQVVRLEPVFWAPELYAQALTQALSAEGFVVATDPLGPKSIMVLPLAATNQTLVFAADKPTMDRVLYWARELDTPSTLGDTTTTYVYEVRNTSASALGTMLINAGSASGASDSSGRVGGANALANQALGQPGGQALQAGRGGGQNIQNQGGGGRGGLQNLQNVQNLQNLTGLGVGQVGRLAGQVRAGQAVAGAVPSGGSITVDDIGNRILFTGTASQFAALRNLLQRLDEPAKEVIVEVTVAEVSLTDETYSGVEFFINQLKAGGTLSGGTMGPPVASPIAGNPRVPGASGLGRGSTGLNLFFDRIDDYAIAINAISTNNKVNVLSRPRLVARSGAPAFIQVGADVPIVIGQRAVNTGDADENADVTQQIQYRQTGVILNITPVIYGDDRVDLLVSQEVSSARDNPNPAIQSPIIDNRSVSTTLSLGDGQMAVLGGLVEDSFSKGNSGIPFLKDIPILGYPFRVDSVTGRKTELVVLITPFIIRDDDDMSNIAMQMSRDMNESFAVGRGWSYTLTPFAGPASIGYNSPQPVIGGTLRRPEPTRSDSLTTPSP